MAVAAAEAFSGTDVVVYLVDFGQEVLEPLPDGSGHHELPHAEPVASSIAGRAFVQRRAVTADRPDGTRVVTASDDQTARIWNAITGQPVATLPGHTGGVTAVSFSSDGSQRRSR